MKDFFKLSIIVQARTGSTRLPGKMMKTFYNGKSLIEILINNLKKVGVPIIVATTLNTNDDFIADIANGQNVSVFRGDENNVLNRFLEAAKQFNVAKIIRVCADNPLIDIDSLLHLKNSFENSDADYWCFSTRDFTPTIKTHYGFWAEGVTYDALNKVNCLTTESIYREHVTNFIYSNPSEFLIYYEPIHHELEKINLRLTIDTYVDFELVQRIYSELIENKIELNALEISHFINKNPDWIEIMQREITFNIK